MNTLRKFDSACEESLGNFLNKYFYEPISKETNSIFIRNGKSNSSKRTFCSRELQLAGMDYIHIKDGKFRIVDEKAAMDYPAGLKTYTFELMSNGREGWLLNDKLATTDYMLILPRYPEKLSSRNQRKLYGDNPDLFTPITENDFESCELFEIAKKDVINLLEEHGLSKELLYNIARQISSNTLENKYKNKLVDNGKRKYLEILPGIKIIHSYGVKAEAPVNVQLSNEKPFCYLDRLAREHYSVFKHGIFPYKEDTKEREGDLDSLNIKVLLDGFNLKTTVNDNIVNVTNFRDISKKYSSLNVAYNCANSEIVKCMSIISSATKGGQ